MKILIIEDHPLVVDSYISCISQDHVFSEVPKFVIASTCKDAYEVIDQSQSNQFFNLAIIDQRLPAYNEKNILCGAHLATLIKSKSKDCKIIIITSHSEIITVYDLLKNVEPQGFLIKNDVTSEILCEGVIEVMKGNQFFSETVKIVVEQMLQNELMTDVTNRKILIFLSRGYKINDLSTIVHLSVSAIKRRIAQMKEALNVEDDSNLVKQAIQQGYL